MPHAPCRGAGMSRRLRSWALGRRACVPSGRFDDDVMHVVLALKCQAVCLRCFAAPEPSATIEA